MHLRKEISLIMGQSSPL